MASKKFTLLSLLMIGTAAVGYSQLGGTLDYLDSTKIKAKKLPQYNEWKNNSKSSVFPPVPRHMGQFAIYGGLFAIDGDVTSQPGFNVGLSYRKALGYTVSVRGSVSYGIAKGMDIRKSSQFDNNKVYDVYRMPSASYPLAVGPGWFVHNYKAEAITPSLDFLVSLNNIMFHRAKSKFNVYVGAGYTPFIYRTKLDALETGNNLPYNYASLVQNNPGLFDGDRKDIKSALKDFFDGTYETAAVVNDRSANFDQNGNDKWQIRHSFSGIFGTEMRIAPRMSLGLEAKYIMTGDDYMDGFHRNGTSMTADKDNLLFTNFFINFNL